MCICSVFKEGSHRCWVSGDPGVHWSSAKRRRTEERALRQEKTAGGGVGAEVSDGERGRLLAWQAPEQALELHCGQEG